MTEPANNSRNNSHQGGNITPIILFLFLLITGIGVAFLANPDNDIQRFCFAIIIALAAGLGATYLTGQITGGGKLGFINIKSASGGFFLWLITLASFLYFFRQHTYPRMEGKWSYICTGHDSKYQHGGRFIATQINNKWTLKGERMWRDTFNTKMNRWDCSVYNPTKSWHSVSGYIEDNGLSFEYVVNNVLTKRGHEDVHGYATGDIAVDDKGNVIKVKGIFNQIYPSEQISGEIEFQKVSDDDFNKPHWNKNHECGE